MKIKSLFMLVLKFAVLVMAYMLISSLSSAILPEKIVGEVDPAAAVDLLQRSLLVAVANTLIVGALVLRSRVNGWKLMVGLAIAYYGVVTFMSQIETGYFAAPLGVDGETLVRLFLSGLPVAVLYVPLVVWVLGKARSNSQDLRMAAGLPAVLQEWIVKLAVIAVLYVVVYFTFGFFVAWQNPDLVSMYDAANHPQVFNNYRLVPFQVLRGVLWGLLAALLLSLLRGAALEKALLVGVTFAVPMSIGLIFPNNPIMPEESVRMSHLIELLTSNSLFGMLASLVLMHRPAVRRVEAARPVAQ